MLSNRWLSESHVPRKTPHNSSSGFVVLDGELYVLTYSSVVGMTETRRSRHHKRSGTLCIQIYHPKKKMWRFLVTKLPFSYPINVNTVVLSSICLWIKEYVHYCVHVESCDLIHVLICRYTCIIVYLHTESWVQYSPLLTWVCNQRSYLGINKT